MDRSKLTLRNFLNSGAGSVLVLLFLALVLWRAVLFVFSVKFTSADTSLQLWSVSYQILALWGVICGLYLSRHWGGWKSVIGRANIMFALGLCGQLFGQSVSSYYFYKGSSLPYP